MSGLTTGSVRRVVSGENACAGLDLDEPIDTALNRLSRHGVRILSRILSEAAGKFVQPGIGPRFAGTQISAFPRSWRCRSRIRNKTPQSIVRIEIPLHHAELQPGIGFWPVPHRKVMPM